MKFGQVKILLAQEMKRAMANNEAARFIGAAYKNVARTMSSFYSDSDNVTVTKINNLPITDNMKTKLKHLMTLPVPKKPAESLLVQLQKIPGIGAKKAEQLTNAGLKNIKDLSQLKWRKMLTTGTQIALKEKPVQKIPRSYIELVENEIRFFRFPLKKVPTVVIVGSYRRRMPFSKDIDVLLRSDNPKILDAFIDFMNKKFGAVVVSKGIDKASFIISIGRPKLTVKLDAFRADNAAFYSHLLYSTGSKEFNIRMRTHAKRRGLLLNQKGIFRDGKKINKPSDDEAALFKILEFPYTEPWDRK
jgi:DNA polymerase (family 10)